MANSGRADREIRFIPTGHVVIDGSLTIYGNFTRWDEVEIMHSGFTDRESAIDNASPADINGKNVLFNRGYRNRFINCIIHDGKNGYNTDEFTDGCELYGNLIYYHGWVVNPAATFGHAIYGHNKGAYQFKLEDNIIFSSFGHGIGLGSNGYPTYSDLDNILVQGNISFENGVLHADYYRSNILLHCPDPVTGIIINENYLYTGSKLPTASNNRIGEDGYGSVGGTVTNNVIVTPYGLEIDGVTGAVTGNTFIGTLVGFTELTYPDNDYPASYTGVHVRANRYKSGRANVAIYNPTGANTVEVDLSAVTGLIAGDTVNVHNVENYYVDIQSLQLDANKKITVNMQAVNRTVATPAGWAAPTTVFPNFGAFVVEKA